MLLASYVGPSIVAWGAVSNAAEEFGFWVYPFVIFLILSAFTGVFVLIMVIKGKIRLGSGEIWIERRAVAEKARKLAQDIAELYAEFTGEIQQISNESIARSSVSDGLPDRSMEVKFNDRIVSKFTSKFQNRVFEVYSEARVFLKMSQYDICPGTQGLHHADSLPEVIVYLNNLAVRLSDERDQIPMEMIGRNDRSKKSAGKG